MEQKVNVWQANLTSGLILGLLGIVYTLVMYFLDLTFNQVQGYIFLLVLIITLFYLVKSYRDNYLYGIITYGQAVGAGVVIFVYYAVLISIFMYLLYKIIDPDLISKQLAMAEDLIEKRGMPQEAADTAIKFQKKFVKPEVIAISGIFSNMITGLIMSLIVAIFVKKEGNPLLDAEEIK